MHFPRSRMYQPSWPYSSASCRLSCSIRHAGIPAGAFHVCRPPSAQAKSAKQVPEPQPRRPSVQRDSCFSNTSRVHRSGIMPIGQSPLWPRRPLPRKASGEHAPIIGPSPRLGNRRNLRLQKTVPRMPETSGASFADWKILRSGAAPLQGSNHRRCLVWQSFSASLFRLCPRPLWKAFRQDQAARSTTNFTQN